MVSRRAGALSVLGGVHKCGQTVSEKEALRMHLVLELPENMCVAHEPKRFVCWFVLYSQ